MWRNSGIRRQRSSDSPYLAMEAALAEGSRRRSIKSPAPERHDQAIPLERALESAANEVVTPDDEWSIGLPTLEAPGVAHRMSHTHAKAAFGCEDPSRLPDGLVQSIHIHERVVGDGQIE